jgi:hypothetical protein
MYTFGMRALRIAALALLLLPSVAFGAGFAKQSLFLSKTPVTEGDTVMVDAVVENADASAFSGSLVFYSQVGSADKVKIGTASVSMAAGGANAVSVSWTPAAGTYTVTAELTQTNGTVVESESANFTVAPKPVPVSTSSDITGDINSQVQSSAEVQNMISQYIPGISGLSTPIFNDIDAARIKAGSLIDQGLGWAKGQTAGKQPGQVLGASTQNTSPSGLLGTASYIAATIALYILTVLKWIVANTGVFYPVIALLFLYALWRIFARMRRPKY